MQSCSIKAASIAFGPALSVIQLVVIIKCANDQVEIVDGIDRKIQCLLKRALPDRGVARLRDNRLTGIKIKHRMAQALGIARVGCQRTDPGIQRNFAGELIGASGTVGKRR